MGIFLADVVFEAQEPSAAVLPTRGVEGTEGGEGDVYFAIGERFRVLEEEAGSKLLAQVGRGVPTVTAGRGR